MAGRDAGKTARVLLPVESAACDVVGDGIRHEARERLAAHHTVSQFGRTGLGQPTGAAVQPQTRNFNRRLPAMTRPHKNDEFSQVGEFLDALPFVQPRQLVAANDPEKPVRRVQPAEMTHGIERVAGAALAEFELGNLELRLRRGREAQHGEAIPGGGVGALRLVRHLRRGHKDDAIKPVLAAGILSGAEMAKMNRIKSSAQKTNVHGFDVADAAACRKPNGKAAMPDRRVTPRSSVKVAKIHLG